LAVGSESQAWILSSGPVKYGRRGTPKHLPASIVAPAVVGSNPMDHPHFRGQLSANIYGHLFDERKRANAELMDARLTAGAAG